MQQHNSIFELNWELDFPENHHAVFPPSKPVDEEEKEYPSILGEIVTYPQDREFAFLIQADPQDLLQFSTPVHGAKKHHSTNLIWYQTLDRYIHQYYLLAKKRDATQQAVIELPLDIAEKYKHNRNRMKETSKELPVEMAYLSLVTAGFHAKDKSTKYTTPRFTHATYLNMLYRHLWINKGAKKKLSLYFDGVAFRDPVFNEIIPVFSIEDYIEHEYLTGISLSIEISAILMEFTDETLMMAALNSFCSEALPDIIRSPMIFTRNTVARQFFQQILFETSIQKYRWKEHSKIRVSPAIDPAWHRLVQRATIHSRVLRTYQQPFEIVDSQIELALTHVENLLSIVKIPVNLPEYVNNPTYGLAPFCHPKHNNVDVFLKKLSAFSKSDAGTKDLPRSRFYGSDIFVMVNERVKKALYGRDYNTFFPELLGNIQ